MSFHIYLREISQGMPKLSICLNITLFNLPPYLPGANELSYHADKLGIDTRMDIHRQTQAMTIPEGQKVTSGKNVQQT